MMRSQRIGRRYLAAFVMALAFAYLVLGSLGRTHLWTHFLTPLPALVGLFLGWRAWSTSEGRSVGYSTAGLLILLAALAISRLRSGTFE
jgi:hypothetical protein